MFQAQATLSLTVENRASITDILLEELKRIATAGDTAAKALCVPKLQLL